MHYLKHIFLCINRKDVGKPCCANHHAEDAVAYVKEQLKKKAVYGPGKVRVSASGCLGRCKLGPSLVIYPEGVWYAYKNHQDLDRIIEQHVLKDEWVEDLRMGEDTHQ